MSEAGVRKCMILRCCFFGFPNGSVARNARREVTEPSPDVGGSQIDFTDDNLSLVVGGFEASTFAIPNSGFDPFVFGVGIG